MQVLLTIIKAAWSGIATGLYPIGLVIVSALFTYTLTVKTDGISVIREGLTRISDDSRVVALLIVWGFGNFMEGIAGFGTAVAIPAAILVKIGFDPMKAILCCLVANTTPTAFGSAGVPTLVLAEESGCAMEALSPTIVQLELAITALNPFLIVFVMDGWRGLRERWGVALSVCIAFLLPWWLLSRFGCELPDIVGGAFVMLAIATQGKWRELDLREQLRAWSPFLFVFGALTIGAMLPASCKVSPGFLILGAAIVAGLVLKLRAGELMKIFASTIVKYRRALITICGILALAKILGAVGAIDLVAKELVSIAGSFYPAFAPVVGALGGFITGSGTSSNVIFGHLQASVAGDASTAVIYAAANVMGAGIGKMICPQSIVLGCAAAEFAITERAVFRKALRFFVPVLLLSCVVTFVFSIH